MWAAHERLSLLFIILLIGSQESFRPLTPQGLWMGLFTGCLWRCSERCLNKNYSSGAVCSVWESRTARRQGCCAGKQRHRLDTSPSKTPKGFCGFGATPPCWRGGNHLTGHRCTADLEKGIKRILLAGSGRGGRLQHLWDVLGCQQPSADLRIWLFCRARRWQRCCLQPALQFLGEGAAQHTGYWLAVGFLWHRSAPWGSPAGASPWPHCCAPAHQGHFQHTVPYKQSALLRKF